MRSLIPADVIFSIRRIYVDGLLSGKKCVELRRRVPMLDVGTRVWFYSKIPDGELRAVGVLEGIKTGAPSELWERYSRCSGLTKDEFFLYFAGVDQGAALVFDTVARLKRPIPLAELRELEPNFQPPQFFRHIRSSALRDELTTAAVEPPSPHCNH